MAQEKRGPGRPPGSKNKTTNKKEDKEKAKAKVKEIQAQKRANKVVIDEIWAIITIAIGVFIFVAVIVGGAGAFGGYVCNFLNGLFGHMSYVLPFYLIIFGILMLCKKTSHFSFKTVLLLFVLLLMMCIINSTTRYIDSSNLELSFEAIKGFYTSGEALLSGGLFGMTLSILLIKGFGKAGLWIFTIAVFLICVLLILDTPVSKLFSKIGEKLEERKLMKEHYVTTYQDSEDIQVVETSFNKRQKEIPKETQAENHIKIVNGNMPSEPQYNAYIPPSQIKVEDLSANKKENILKYMNDEFKVEKTGSLGLEQKSESQIGFGLDGNNACLERTSTPAINQNDLTPDKEIPQKLSKKEASQAMLTTEELNQAGLNDIKEYKKPPVTLLTKATGKNQTNTNLLTAKAQKLEETLRNFHVDARVVQVTQGPTVTRYEIQPAVGVKVNSIVRLSDDIALNLEAKSIRIEAPIPGKAAVGIEVENDAVTMVHLRDIIDSDEFKKSKSKITFAVGKDISGKAIVADLKSMPHLLIAGSTGSGKSVCINSIITSFIYKANPDEVKLILIDPKVVELGNYNGIPHLLIPVVTDPSKAAAALNWAVAEMTDRYKKFAEEGVRDLESYNESVRANEENEKVMPQVVIIIDELADLMMVAPSQIEESICRLAQMARAAGMHLIVATQRPSVDVITGVIKANIPSRIAFAVSSQVDSRTILDMQGAEKLVGKGDMLFNPMGMGKPIRVQGTFVSDSEVNKVIDFVKGQVENASYNEDILSKIDRSNTSDSSDDGDELLADAIELVVRSGQASVSMLQRRFRIGYNRAARIIDMMEARGIIGPQDGSRPRQVLMTEAELDAIENDVEEEQI